MNIKKFTAGFICIFYLFIGLPTALSIAVFPQISWKVILLLIFVISLTTTTVLFIAGTGNHRNGFAATLEKLSNTDTDEAYRIRPILLAAYAFVTAIIVAYIEDRHRELADIATSSAWAACWMFAWGWILRIMEALRGRYLSRKSR